ncbi:MAG: autotransporter assembly complex family protein [Hyphomicrobiales bacterium]
MSAPTAYAFEIFGWKLFEREAAEPPPPDAVYYAPALDVDSADEDLKTLLTDVSELVSQTERPPAGTAALVARARGDRGRLVAALYSKGYYGGTVDIRIAGRPLESIAPDTPLSGGADGKVPVTVRVSPGPVFAFDQTRIDVAGEGDADAPSSDPAAYDLARGGVAESSLVLGAEERLVADWRERGRPLARVTDREVVADHQTHTVDVALRVEPGPLARFGRVEVSGTEMMDPEIVKAQAKIPVGEPYSPKALRTAADRLRRLEVFDSVRVREGDALDADGTLPVMIEVTERKRRYVGAGVSWSNTDGAEIEAHWGHRNLFGGAERLRVEGSVSRIGTAPTHELDYELGATFVKPGVFDADTDLTAEAWARQEMPDAYESRSVTAKVGLTRRFSETLSASLGAEVEQAHIEDEFGRHDYTLLGAPAELVWDTRDNPLDPARGFHAIAFAEPMVDVHNDNSFLVAKGSFSAYQAIDEGRRFVLAARVAAGSISGGSVTAVPADRRFYAGGGGSVRGYPYQGVGPMSASGNPVGGLSFIEGSAEVRIRITDKIGLVPFVDVGQVYSSETPDFDAAFKVGAGLGLRYLTPVGPLRLDVAVPLDKEPDDPPVAVYLGLGQSF